MNNRQLKRCYEVAAYSPKSRIRKKNIKRILDTVRHPSDYYFLLRNMVEFKIFSPDLWEVFGNFTLLQRLKNAN